MLRCQIEKFGIKHVNAISPRLNIYGDFSTEQQEKNSEITQSMLNIIRGDGNQSVGLIGFLGINLILLTRQYGKIKLY